MTRNNYDFGLSGKGFFDDDEEKEMNGFSLRNGDRDDDEPFDLSLGRGRDRLGGREEETMRRRPLRRRSRRRMEMEEEEEEEEGNRFRETQEQLTDLAGVAILGGVAVSVTDNLF